MGWTQQQVVLLFAGISASLGVAALVIPWPELKLALGEQIDRAVQGFSSLEGIDEELATKLVEQGFMSYDDLSVIENLRFTARVHRMAAAEFEQRAAELLFTAGFWRK